MDAFEQELIRESHRVYARYALEVVERWSLCPWATRARQEARLSARVILEQNPTHIASTLNELTNLEQDSQIEVGLLIFPLLPLDRLDFEHFVATVREADAARHPLGGIPFATAAFHPRAMPDVSEPQRLIPFLRRTPDPTIQAVRRSVLERIRSSAGEGTQFVDLSSIIAGSDVPSKASLRQRIAQTNLETVRDTGVEQVSAALDSVLKDREQSYARIARRYGREIPSWGFTQSE